MSNFVELHNKVEDSLALLDNFQTFLSTFQSDLSHVSGQISNLQERSKDIDSRSKARRRIEKPLSSLLSDLCIPPEHAVLLLDTDVTEEWIPVVRELERRLDALKARPKVKASRDLSEVAEGLRIAAASKIRALFLALLLPIRTNMSTNIHVLQTSVLLKYQPLFAFLQRHAPPVALELQRAYAGAARTYYETGFRRYTRTIAQLHSRFAEKVDLISHGAVPVPRDDVRVDIDRLSNANVDGPPVTLAYQADDKNFHQHVEGLFRSLHLVLMDNATAEYAFILAFFATSKSPLEVGDSFGRVSSIALSPSPLSPTMGAATFDETTSDIDGVTPTARRFSINLHDLTVQRKEEKAALDAIWKSVLDPAVQYCQVFTKTVLAGPPPVIALLSMLRLNETVLSEVQTRGGCAPLESYLIGLRLTMWPIFQNQMNAHVDALKKLADSAVGGLFSSGTVKDATINGVVQRFCLMFLSFIGLAVEEADEAMVFSQMNRLREELVRLIVTQSNKVKDTSQAASYQSSIYETVLQYLTGTSVPTTHPRAQAEIAFWRGREEEARRRVAITQR